MSKPKNNMSRIQKIRVELNKIRAERDALRDMLEDSFLFFLPTPTPTVFY